MVWVRSLIAFPWDSRAEGGLLSVLMTGRKQGLDQVPAEPVAKCRHWAQTDKTSGGLAHAWQLMASPELYSILSGVPVTAPRGQTSPTKPCHPKRLSPSCHQPPHQLERQTGCTGTFCQCSVSPCHAICLIPFRLPGLARAILGQKH